ncbi:hypothetical protein D3C81_1912570 [compost metagenome]
MPDQEQRRDAWQIQRSMRHAARCEARAVHRQHPVQRAWIWGLVGGGRLEGGIGQGIGGDIERGEGQPLRDGQRRQARETHGCNPPRTDATAWMRCQCRLNCVR